MMTTTINEQVLRREAIRRRLSGERRKEICQDLGRSTRWFDKWWAAFQKNPEIDFADGSRAPVTRRVVATPEVERLVIEIRQVFERASYGLIGARAIWGKLLELNVTPLPSQATIQRILARAELTHPVGVAAQTAYYPWLPVLTPNSVHATDIITKHLKGGQPIHHFHTLDLYTQAVAATQHLDKTSLTACAHLVHVWQHLGLPDVQQFDNEAAFCGGYTHRHVIGRMLRLCLFCGIEPLFTPVYDPKRNYQIETFHSLWCQAFWSRRLFTSLLDVQAHLPEFLDWYYGHYRPPCLGGKTPAQLRLGVRLPSLTPGLRCLIPDFETQRLPLTSGRIHFMRKVDPAGYIEFLNDRWVVGPTWIGTYVRATLHTDQQLLTISHKPGPDAEWTILKTRGFHIQEPVQELLPSFLRHRARCCDWLPG